MNEYHVLQRHFSQIGATLEVEVVPTGTRRLTERGWSPSAERTFLLDVREERRNEAFVLTVREDSQPVLELQTLNMRPDMRHLLLMVKTDPFDKQKFLCGHDERHWFVASVPGGTTTVDSAMEALKPPLARAEQRANGVKGKNWQRRHNAGFIRQGEWFFLPRPRFTAPEWMLYHHEPIRRSGGTAHMVEWVYREGGTTVYVCSRHPAGVSEAQYKRLLETNPQARRWSWGTMRREPRVYARGKVRHPDHATIELPFWHLVVMSGELVSSNVVFLD